MIFFVGGHLGPPPPPPTVATPLHAQYMVRSSRDRALAD